MSPQDLLFELGTEELPPHALMSMSAALTEGVVKGIEAAGIPHGRVHGFATPRRLAVRIQKLAAHQPDRQVERRGPPLKNSFDAEGAPTQAALAFAKNCGVAVTDLARLETDKGAWLVFRGTERGAATVSLLGDIVNQAVAALPTPKRMRWGAGAVEFVRPVHSVVLLYGETVVPALVGDVAAYGLTGAALEVCSVLATRTATPSAAPASSVMTGVEGFMSRSTPSGGSRVQSGPNLLFLPFGGVRGGADTAAHLGCGDVAEP